jgi:hypothetical protein
MHKKLKDIAEVRTGYQFRGRVVASDEANVAVIQIKDVNDDLVVDLAGLVRVKVDKPEPFLVAQGDVLFLSRGHRQYATTVTQPVHNTIATGYFFIVRPRTDLILADFLAWTINQTDFQDALRPFVRGTHMALVSKAQFEQITIRVPSLSIQARVMTCHSLFEHEKQLSAAILAKRQQLVQAVCHRLITGQSTVPGTTP